MPGWHRRPAEDGGVVKAQLARQSGRAASLPDYVGDLHSAECGTCPHPLSSGNVGSSRTSSVGEGHNRHMDQKQTMGSRLRDLRKSRGLTQTAVAAATGVERSHLSKIESDQDAPGRANLGALATFYNVTMDYLQTGAKPIGPEVGHQGRDSEADAGWVALGREIEELDDAIQDAIISFIRTISRAGRGRKARSRRPPRKR